MEQQLEGLPLKQLRQAAEVLSQRYRTEAPTASAHLASDLAAAAYLAVRFPATFSAVRRAMAETADVHPEFAPVTQLDAGSGPGTAVLAAGDVWPSLRQALLLEGSAPIRQSGEPLVAASGIAAEWRAGDLASTAIPDSSEVLTRFDLVTCAYVLSELSATAQRLLVEHLWSATAGVLLLVEPGTPAGWQRILEARTALLHAGAQILAPCPHAFACPLVSPDWCHFAERVERSRMHRLVKQGDVPWEDEKFLYLAVSREERPVKPKSRVLTRPKINSGLIALKLCNPDGTMTQPGIRKRDKIYKQARRTDWGETLDFMLDNEQ
ncbi:small ribosomal subunit Rsm22 family protein [Terriglobus albidus]|uniref:small ribosomal subunit Rsm22 family protein n=1 Tax=Terriglobus albidus TaxID=1592106 RepID=UPI0021DF482B|nr:small ribosomal subunit Rsm22 family protein [Terriglobus albidus]